MKPATDKQVLEVGVLVVRRVNWEAVDSDILRQVISDQDRLGRELTKFFHNGGQTEIVLRQFPVWRTITVGHVVAKDAIAELEKKGIEIFVEARSIMFHRHYATLEAPLGMELAKAKVRELAFTTKPTTEELWARIGGVGGLLCPAEAGPEIRKNLDDQEKGTTFFLAMKDIPDRDGDPAIFCFTCDERAICFWKRIVWKPTNSGISTMKLSLVFASLKYSHKHSQPRAQFNT